VIRILVELCICTLYKAAYAEAIVLMYWRVSWGGTSTGVRMKAYGEPPEAIFL